MPAPLRPADFTAQAADFLTENGHPSEVLGELLLEVEVDAGRVAAVRLHTLWAIAGEGENPDPVDALARLLATVRAQVRPARDAAHIVPFLRSSAQLAGLLHHDPQLPSQPLCPGLWVTYMFDQAAHLRQLRRIDADLLRLPDAQLHARACANLARRARPRILPGGPLRRVVLDGELDASALLLGGFWDAHENELGEGVIALPLAPSLLLVAPPRTPVAVLQRWATARLPGLPQAFVQPPLLRRTDAGWEGIGPAALSSGFPPDPLG